jgi:hypothetical protein
LLLGRDGLQLGLQFSVLPLQFTVLASQVAHPIGGALCLLGGLFVADLDNEFVFRLRRFAVRLLGLDFRLYGRGLQFV